jgi:hypothetical protein
MLSGVRYRTMKVTRPVMIAIAGAVLLTLSPATFARDDWHHGDGWHHDWHDTWRGGDRPRFGYDDLWGFGYVDPIYPYPNGEEPIYPYAQQPADVDPPPFESSSDPPPFSPWVDPPPFLAPAE